MKKNRCVDNKAHGTGRTSIIIFEDVQVNHEFLSYPVKTQENPKSVQRFDDNI